MDFIAFRKKMIELDSVLNSANACRNDEYVRLEKRKEEEAYSESERVAGNLGFFLDRKIINQHLF